MEPADRDVELMDVLVVIFRYRNLIFLGTVGLGLLAFFASFFFPNIYEATSTLMYQSQKMQVKSETNIETTVSVTPLNTFFELIQTKENGQKVIDQLKKEEIETQDLSPTFISGLVQLNPIQNTNLFNLTVSDLNPKRAFLINQIVTNLIMTQMQSLMNRDLEQADEAVRVQMEASKKELSQYQEEMARLKIATQIGLKEDESKGLQTEYVEKISKGIDLETEIAGKYNSSIGFLINFQTNLNSFLSYAESYLLGNYREFLLMVDQTLNRDVAERIEKLRNEKEALNDTPEKEGSARQTQENMASGQDGSSQSGESGGNGGKDALSGNPSEDRSGKAGAKWNEINLKKMETLEALAVPLHEKIKKALEAGSIDLSVLGDVRNISDGLDSLRADGGRTNFSGVLENLSTLKSALESLKVLYQDNEKKSKGLLNNSDSFAQDFEEVIGMMSSYDALLGQIIEASISLEQFSNDGKIQLEPNIKKEYDSLKELETGFFDSYQQFRESYTAHKKLDSQIDELKTSLENSQKTISETKLSMANLERLIQISSESNSILQKKDKELQIMLATQSKPVELIEPASLPTGSSKPQRNKFFLTGLGAGLFLFTILSFFIHYVRTYPKDRMRA